MEPGTEAKAKPSVSLAKPVHCMHAVPCQVFRCVKVGGYSQLHPNLCPITSPDRPGLPVFTLKNWERPGYEAKRACVVFQNLVASDNNFGWYKNNFL